MEKRKSIAPIGVRTPDCPARSDPLYRVVVVIIVVVVVVVVVGGGGGGGGGVVIFTGQYRARFETRTYETGSRGLKSTYDVPFIFVPLDTSRTATYTYLRENKLEPGEFRLLQLKEMQYCSESILTSLRNMLHDLWQLIILRHIVSEGLLLKKSLYRKHMALDQTSLGVLFASF